MKIIDDIKLYNSYKKTLKENRNELLQKYNIRIDDADRMYTVINLPDEFFEEPYNIRKADIDTISEQYIKEYISSLSKFLDSIGLREMYTYYDTENGTAGISKVGRYSYLLVLGFTKFNSVEFNTIIWRRIIPISSVIAIGGLLLFFLL